MHLVFSYQVLIFLSRQVTLVYSCKNVKEPVEENKEEEDLEVLDTDAILAQAANDLDTDNERERDGQMEQQERGQEEEQEDNDNEGQPPAHPTALATTASTSPSRATLLRNTPAPMRHGQEEEQEEHDDNEGQLPARPTALATPASTNPSRATPTSPPRQLHYESSLSPVPSPSIPQKRRHPIAASDESDADSPPPPVVVNPSKRKRTYKRRG